MLKRFIVLFIILCLLFWLASVGKALAQPGLITFKVTIQIGNKIFDINNAGYVSESPPCIIKDRTLTAVSFVSTIFDCPIDVNPITQEIKFNHNYIWIRLEIGSKEAWITSIGQLEETKVVLDSPPQIIDNIVFVPIRFVSETFGFRVTWDEKDKKVIIDNCQKD